MSGCGIVQPSTRPPIRPGSTPRWASARAVTSAARSRLETSASVPCHLVNGELPAIPAGMATSSYFIRYSLWSGGPADNDSRGGRLGVQQPDQVGAVAQHPALIDVTLVGDLPAVEAGRAAHHQQPPYAPRRTRPPLAGGQRGRQVA